MSDYVFWWRLRDAARALLKGKPEDATPQQRKTLMDELATYCGDGTVPMVLDKNGRTDEYQTGKQAGRLEVLLYLRQILSLEDEQLLKMKDLEDEQEKSS